MLWDTDVVAKAELTEKFPAAKDAKDRRRIIAAKVLKTKTVGTEAVTDDNISRIHVGAVDSETLDKLTLQSAINLANAKGECFTDDYSEETLIRWKLNFIRHELTAYGKDIASTSNFGSR